MMVFNFRMFLLLALKLQQRDYHQNHLKQNRTNRQPNPALAYVDDKQAAEVSDQV